MSNFNIDHLRKAHELINKPDSLEERGIPKDHVFVIHPSLVHKLKEYSKPAIQPSLFATALGSMSNLIGRQVYSIADAPLDKIEVMSEMDMYVKYKDHFLNIARINYERRQEEERELIEQGFETD